MHDDTFNTSEPSNITDSELLLPLSQPDRRPGNNPFIPISRPLDQPTKSTFLILHYRLAKIIGILQARCHGLQERRLADVYKCEELFKAYAADLPRHFRLDEQVDTSLDHLAGFEWIRYQRLSLHSKYHLARVALHRPFVALFGVPETDASRKACILSSLADLKLRTTTQLSDPLDRFKWLTVSIFYLSSRARAEDQVASGFQAATVIGCYCISLQQHRKLPRNDPRLSDVGPMLALLESYIEMEEKTTRQDEQLFVELQVLRICVDYIRNPSKLVRSRESSRQRGRRGGSISRRHHSSRVRDLSECNPSTKNLPVRPPLPTSMETASPPHPSLAAILNDPVPIPIPTTSFPALSSHHSGPYSSEHTPRGPSAALSTSTSTSTSAAPANSFPYPLEGGSGEWHPSPTGEGHAETEWGLGLFDHQALPSDPTGPGGMMPAIVDPALWDIFFLNMPLWSNTERGEDLPGWGLGGFDGVGAHGAVSGGSGEGVNAVLVSQQGQRQIGVGVGAMQVELGQEGRPPMTSTAATRTWWGRGRVD
jgi:hypothetical protein